MFFFLNHVSLLTCNKHWIKNTNSSYLDLRITIWQYDDKMYLDGICNIDAWVKIFRYELFFSRFTMYVYDLNDLRNTAIIWIIKFSVRCTQIT